MHTSELGMLDLSRIMGTTYDTLQEAHGVLPTLQAMEPRIPP